MDEPNKPKTNLFKESYEKSIHWLTKVWRPVFGISISLLALAVVLFMPGPLIYLAAIIPTYLPLTLPILMVLVSIGVRINELSARQGWLDLCNYFASGYVTFAIWALVSGESVKRYIWINQQKVLDKSYAVPLIVTAFGLLAVCSLVTVLAKKHDSKNVPLKSNSENLSLTGWQTVQALFVGLSLLALLYPVRLFEDKATVEARTGKSLELKSFTVSIGYRDPSFNQYLGRSSNPIQLCVIYRSVAAKTPEEAKDSSLKIFMESEQSNQYVPNRARTADRPPKRVEIERAWIVAESDSSS